MGRKPGFNPNGIDQGLPGREQGHTAPKAPACDGYVIFIDPVVPAQDFQRPVHIQDHHGHGHRDLLPYRG